MDDASPEEQAAYRGARATIAEVSRVQLRRSETDKERCCGRRHSDFDNREHTRSNRGVRNNRSVCINLGPQPGLQPEHETKLHRQTDEAGRRAGGAGGRRADGRARLLHRGAIKSES